MIKLKDYIIELQALVEEHGDLPLYTSDDDEGNGYTAVSHSPGLYYTPKAEYRLEEIHHPADREEAGTPRMSNPYTSKP
jgi:hypothetical protein